MYKKIISNRRAMTLIELLVVIAIIGILAATVFTAVSSVKKKAKEARVKSNLAQLITAGKIFYKDHDSTYAGLESDPSFIALKNDNHNLGADWGDDEPGGYLVRDTATPSKSWGLIVTAISGEATYCIDSFGYNGLSNDLYNGGQHDQRITAGLNIPPMGTCAPDGHGWRNWENYNYVAP